jgi:hypothetical protein
VIIVIPWTKQNVTHLSPWTVAIYQAERRCIADDNALYRRCRENVRYHTFFLKCDMYGTLFQFDSMEHLYTCTPTHVSTFISTTNPQIFIRGSFASHDQSVLAAMTSRVTK